MKPAPFAYHAPETLDEALALMAEHGDEAKVLAGGQSLVPAMSFRLAQPAVLVDLNRIDALSHVRETAEDGVTVGAMTRQRAVERDPLVAARAPLVVETLGHVAHPQIRNRGTFGGSLAHADPAAELPAVALTLDARFQIASVRGTRTVQSEAFFTDLFETDLAPDELLVSIDLPALAPRTGTAFEELARRHGDYALVGVAARITLDLDGRIADARVAYLSVGPGPVLARHAAASLIGTGGTEDEMTRAARIAAHDDVTDPPTDIHATAAYRRRLIQVLTVRALRRAMRKASNHSEG